MKAKLPNAYRSSCNYWLWRGDEHEHASLDSEQQPALWLLAGSTSWHFTFFFPSYIWNASSSHVQRNACVKSCRTCTTPLIGRGAAARKQVWGVFKQKLRLVYLQSCRKIVWRLHPSYLLQGLRWWPPSGLLHLAALRGGLLGHRAVLALLGGGGGGRGRHRRRGGRGWRCGNLRSSSNLRPENGHVLRGREMEAAQAFVRLLINHQQPRLMVHCLDPLHHLTGGQNDSSSFCLEKHSNKS